MIFFLNTLVSLGMLSVASSAQVLRLITGAAIPEVLRVVSIRSSSVVSLYLSYNASLSVALNVLYSGLSFTAAKKVSFRFGGRTRLTPQDVFSMVPGNCWIIPSVAVLEAAFALATIAAASGREAKKGGEITGSPTYGAGGGGTKPEVSVSIVSLSGIFPGLQECP